MDHLLAIKNLRVEFETASGLLPAVSCVDLVVGRRESVCIVGESGCGKTMTALATMGIVPHRGRTSGEIFFDGEDLLKLSPETMRHLRGDRIAMIFQDPMTALNPLLTIGRQLCEPLRLHRDMSSRDSEKRAIEMLDLVRVPQAASRLKQYPHQLSGGLAQRVMIAMALICEPELLIADEPTTALDVTIQAQILDLLREIRSVTSASVLMITHDLGVVAEFADRVYVMYAGYVVESADVFEIFDHPHHCYTSGLLKSLPGEKDHFKQGPLYRIPGVVPRPADLPAGCPFAPRCDAPEALCRESLPPLRQVGPGHMSRCLLKEKTNGD